MSREEFRTLIKKLQSEKKSVPFCSDVREIPISALPSFYLNNDADRTEIILPVTTEDVKRLKTVSSQAPYGKGKDRKQLLTEKSETLFKSIRKVSK
jgi:hypothetical protein